MQPTAGTRPPNLVVGYDATSVRLRERVLTRSALVTPEQVQDWSVAGVEALDEAALAPVLALGAEVVLLATGPRQRFPDPRLLARAAAAGVGLEVMDTGAACRTYNVLVADGRAAALALILPGG